MLGRVGGELMKRDGEGLGDGGANRASGPSMSTWPSRKGSSSSATIRAKPAPVQRLSERSR